MFELSEKKILSFSAFFFFLFFFTALNPQPYPALPPFRSSVRPSIAVLVCFIITNIGFGHFHFAYNVSFFYL